MRKLMVMAAMLAMVLAAAAPAFAQDATAVDDSTAINTGDNVEFNAVAQNIIGSIGDITQTQSGEADAVAFAGDADADDESVATADAEADAEVAQEQGVLVLQFNSALNDF